MASAGNDWMGGARSGRGVAYQIPRNTLALLMVAQVTVVLPFLLYLSPLIVAVSLFCVAWRAGVYQGRWDYPQRWVKAVLVVGSVVSAAFSGIGAYSLESAATLLILAFALKLIEMRSRRDAYLVIFLGYFVIATLFLFDQSISAAAYGLLAVVLVTAAMVSLNQLMTRVRPLASLRLAATLIAQALPFAVVLFLFFPRIAPLWTVPLPGASKTGMSERVTPGDIAALSRSDELAFRVVFDGPVPAPRDLYWRGLVYSRYADGTWTVGGALPDWDGVAPAPDPDWRGIPYEVLLEPTQSTWLFALDTPWPRSPGVDRSRDFRLEAEDPVLAVFRYRATAYPQWRMDLSLPEALRWRETRLPDADNPRIRDYARRLFADNGEPRAFINAVLAAIRSEPFFYTLNPPTLPRRDAIDQFWFESRRGFCSHYAGALVFMLRSVGIPARMVGGYQGGEVNPIDGHLMVRQFDAHAWAEAWLDGEGWVRVDPTSAVAPARIESGLNAALSQEDRAALSALTNARLSNWGLLNDAIYWVDSLEHRWNLWVVGYDANMQSNLLTKLLGEISAVRIGAAILVGGGVTVGLVAVSLFWRRRPVRRHPVERLFARFCLRLGAYGWPRHPGEAPATFLRRLAAAGLIAEDESQQLVAELDDLLYNPDAVRSAVTLRDLRRQLRRLQLRLAFATSR
ncbi:MAG: DUF3488 and transglutaminase-like domain-containing protein [Pseudomonadales bacterium]